MTINTRSPGKAVFCVTERHVAYEDGGPLCFRFSRCHSSGVKSLAEGGDAGEIGAFPSEAAANVLEWQGLRDFGLSSSGGEEEAENLSATAGPSRPERPSLAPSPGGSPEPSLRSPGASHHLRARRPQTPSGGAGGVCEPPPGLPRSRSELPAESLALSHPLASGLQTRKCREVWHGGKGVALGAELFQSKLCRVALGRSPAASLSCSVKWG